jgi:Uri superfamily endonuclease
MFGGNKVKLNKDILERAKKVAEVAGYSSVEEFVEHVLEKELKEIESTGSSDADITESLRGLGYIS